MLLSRFRTLEEYGTYSQITIVVTIAISIFTLGLPGSINYFLASYDKPKLKQEFLSTYLSLSTLLSFIAGAALVLLMPWISGYFKNEMLQNFVYVCAILPWARVISGSIDNVLVVQQKTGLLMLYRLIFSLCLLFAIVITKKYGLSFNEYVLMLVFVEVVFAVVAYLIIGKGVGHLRLRFNLTLVKKILSFSVPLGLATLVGTIGLELSKLTIGRLLNTEALALYANAGRELPITIFSSSLIAVLMPRLVRMLNEGKMKEAISLWGDTVVASYIIMCFSTTVCFVFAPQIMTVLYSEKYLPGVSVFKVYSLVLLLRTTYFGIILNSIGKTKFILYSSLLSLIVNVVLNFVFFKIFGFIGPAIATVLSIGIVNFFQLYYSAKVVHCAFQNIFPWGELFSITLVNILLGMVFYFLINILKIGVNTTSIIITIGLGIIWATGYYVLMGKKFKSKLL